VCVYQTQAKHQTDNLKDFHIIAAAAAKNGIKRCITSFFDDYAKIRRRTAAIEGFAFIDRSIAHKVETLLSMEAALAGHNIRLLTCCEKTVLAALPQNASIRSSRCIPNDLLVELFGAGISLKKDTGQRQKAGCGCMTSVDVGSYHEHPCFHNCLFCYANPSAPATTPLLPTKELRDANRLHTTG
jgi:hypothetical protein